VTGRSALVVVVAVMVTVGTTYLWSRRDETRRGRDVVTIIQHGGIGPARDFHRGYHPYDAGFAALPDTMPKATTNWDSMCGESGWEVVYKNDDHRFYSSCNSVFPAALQPAACGLAGFELPAIAGAPNCGSKLSGG